MFEAPGFIYDYKNSSLQEMCDIGATVYGLKLSTPRGIFRYVYDNYGNMIVWLLFVIDKSCYVQNLTAYLPFLHYTNSVNKGKSNSG